LGEQLSQDRLTINHKLVGAIMAETEHVGTKTRQTKDEEEEVNISAQK